jgi:hypothetical protein
MSGPTRRGARWGSLAAVVVAIVASAALVWQSSYSAFTATTTNPGNSWATGSVVLADDDNNTAMFSVTGMKPGQTGTHCIAVTSSGTLPSTVKLYGTGSTGPALSPYINLTIADGTGGTFASCAAFTQTASLFSGTLSGFATSFNSFSTGLGSWAPTGTASETRAFKFTYTLSSTTPDTAQNSTATIGFTWEAQSS